MAASQGMHHIWGVRESATQDVVVVRSSTGFGTLIPSLLTRLHVPRAATNGSGGHSCSGDSTIPRGRVRVTGLVLVAPAPTKRGRPGAGRPLCFRRSDGYSAATSPSDWTTFSRRFG